MRRIILIAILMLHLPVGHAQDNVSRALVVAHQEDYRPYCHLNRAGQSEGLLIDWWKLWASKVDTNIQFKAGSLEECMQWLNNGSADVVAGLLVDGQQQESLLYGELIIRVQTTLFLKNDLSPKSIHMIKDSIGVMRSPSKQIIASQYPELKLKYFNTTEGLLNALSDQSLAGFFYDIPSPIGDSEPPGSDLIHGYYAYVDIRNDALRPAMTAENTKLQTLLQLGTGRITLEEMSQLAGRYKLILTEKGPGISNAQLLLLAVAIALGLIILTLVLRGLILTPKEHPLKQDNWREIIDRGESDRTEFKSSLRWDYRKGKENKALEYVIIKSIAAFMNSEGGRLFIGVNDEGDILGLDNDYSVIFKGNADGFLLVITNLVNKYLGRNAHRLIRANITTIGNADVCVVTISKSPEPVFLKKGEEEEFYIRTSAASVPLGMSDSAEYVRQHFT